MPSLEQVLQQRQELRQYQLQRLEVLAMSSDELNDYLNQAEAENPLIDILRDRSEIERELSIAKQFKNHERSEGRFFNDDNDYPEPEIPDSSTTTLEQYLNLQIRFRKQPAERQKILHYLIGCIEDNGRLPITAAQTAAECGCSEEDAACCLALLRGLQPTGVCADSLESCLLVQLEALPERNETAERLVRTCLNAVGETSVAQLAKRCKASTAEMEQALQLIRELEPFPGASFAPSERMYVVPDVLLVPGENGLEVQLCDKWCGSVQISRYYVQMLKGSHDQESTLYLYDRLQHARALIQSIEQRRRTLLRLSESILEHQRPFLERGEPLQALSLSDLAAECSCHESTVSRALRGKYLCCPRGTYAMRKFVTTAVGTSGASTDRISTELRRLIAEEDKSTPLSDRQLADQLAALGLPVSRRTVAKYRIQLSIPNAFARRS